MTEIAGEKVVDFLGATFVFGLRVICFCMGVFRSFPWKKSVFAWVTGHVTYSVKILIENRWKGFNCQEPRVWDLKCEL